MARIKLLTLHLLVPVGIAVAPPLVTHLLLQATGPILVVTLWAAAVALLIAHIPGMASPLRQIAKGVVAALTTLAGLILPAAMVIIPLSAYLLWMELVLSGVARGAVSFIFVMLVGFGSALFGGYVRRRPVTASAAYAAWLAFLSIPLFQRTESLVVLVAALLLLLIAAPSQRRRFADSRRATVHAAVLLAFTAAMAMGLSAATSPRGSRLVDRVLSPRFRRIVVSALPEFPIMYDVPGYGYRLPVEEVSASPVLSNRGIFRVTTERHAPVYLRTEVFHVFTGSSWQVSDAVLSAAPESQQARAREPDNRVSLRPASARLPDSSEEGIERTQIVVLTDFYPAIPHTLDTHAVSVRDRDRLVFERPGEDIGYALREPLLHHEVITLYRQPVAVPEDTPASIYLDVAPDTATEIRELAERLKGPTPSESILNTLRFLRGEFEYTLEPPRPQDRSDFLTAFLFDHRRGYCVQFATAFTVITRLQGIPTRYVTGFLVQPPQIDDVLAEIDGIGEFDIALTPDVIVTGYSSHAWPEVWLPEHGWRTVEATPPMQPYGYENLFFDRWESIRDEGRTVQQLQQVMQTGSTETQTESGFAVSLPDLPPWIPAWLVALPVIALAAVYGRRLLRPAGDAARFRSAVKKLRARSVRAGYPRPERLGWTRWAHRADNGANRVAQVILAVSFGGRAPSRRDVRLVREFTRRRIASRSRRNGAWAHSSGAGRSRAPEPGSVRPS